MKNELLTTLNRHRAVIGKRDELAINDLIQVVSQRDISNLLDGSDRLATTRG